MKVVYARTKATVDWDAVGKRELLYFIFHEYSKKTNVDKIDDYIEEIVDGDKPQDEGFKIRLFKKSTINTLKEIKETKLSDLIKEVSTYDRVISTKIPRTISEIQDRTLGELFNREVLARMFQMPTASADLETRLDNGLTITNEYIKSGLQKRRLKTKKGPQTTKEIQSYIFEDPKTGKGSKQEELVDIGFPYVGMNKTTRDSGSAVDYLARGSADDLYDERAYQFVSDANPKEIKALKEEERLLETMVSSKEYSEAVRLLKVINKGKSSRKQLRMADDKLAEYVKVNKPLTKLKKDDADYLDLNTFTSKETALKDRILAIEKETISDVNLAEAIKSVTKLVKENKSVQVGLDFSKFRELNTKFNLKEPETIFETVGDDDDDLLEAHEKVTDEMGEEETLDEEDLDYDEEIDEDQLDDEEIAEAKRIKNRQEEALDLEDDKLNTLQEKNKDDIKNLLDKYKKLPSIKGAIALDNNIEEKLKNLMDKVKDKSKEYASKTTHSTKFESSKVEEAFTDPTLFLSTYVSGQMSDLKHIYRIELDITKTITEESNNFSVTRLKAYQTNELLPSNVPKGTGKEGKASKFKPIRAVVAHDSRLPAETKEELVDIVSSFKRNFELLENSLEVN